MLEEFEIDRNNINQQVKKGGGIKLCDPFTQIFVFVFKSKQTLYAMILNDGHLQARGCNLDIITQSPKGSFSCKPHTFSIYVYAGWNSSSNVFIAGHEN